MERALAILPIIALSLFFLFAMAGIVGAQTSTPTTSPTASPTTPGVPDTGVESSGSFLLILLAVLGIFGGITGMSYYMIRSDR